MCVIQTEENHFRALRFLCYPNNLQLRSFVDGNLLFEEKLESYMDECCFRECYK